MAEPYYSPNNHQSASDVALEQALERVRDDARARARENRQRPNADDTGKSSTASSGAHPTSRRTKNSADSDRHVPRASRHEKQRARPVALYALAFVIIAALGFVGIQAIHDTTPAIKGFASTVDQEAAAQGDGTASAAVTSDLTSSVTAALMRTQGWVLPGHVQTVDPVLAKIRQQELPDLASEIAQVPAIEMDVDPAQELAAMSDQNEAPELNEELPLPPPPPPAFGSLGGFPDVRFGSDPQLDGPVQGDPFTNREQLALPPLQNGGDMLTGPAGPDPLAGTAGAFDGNNPNGAPPLPVNSMLEGINQATPGAGPTTQAAPAPQAQVPTPTPAGSRPGANLAQLQEQACSRLGFFARISCKDDVRRDFCADRWNRHPDCVRTERTQNY